VKTDWRKSRFRTV